MIGNRKDEIQRREMMIYFIQIKRFRVFVGSHLVTGQNKNPIQNYDIDIYCISIQGTKKRRRRFFLLRNMLGGKPSHSQKKTAFTVVFATNPPASISAVPPKKKTSTSIEVKNPQDLMHLQHDKDVVVFWKKVSFGGGGWKYTRTSKGCNLVSQCSLT